jgi:hypothetical protein
VHISHLYRRLVVATILACQVAPAFADVAVLANRTNSEVIVQIAPAGEAERTLSLASGVCRPVFFNRAASIRFGQILAPQVYDLAHGAAYFFANERDGQTLRMERIGLGPSDLEQQAPLPWDPAAQPKKAAFTLPVKIAVDEDEPTHRSVWEPRLRERIEAASQILEQHCGVKLSVNSVVTWQSDNKLRDFSLSMREFEREVSAAPARLVIGFSSQYDFTLGRLHLGGSRGALYPYILLKERAPNVREPEKLELLVHELCHFLGASHSPEPTSVMRPVLSISQLRSTGGRIYIDPVNTLLMSLVGDELRQGGISNLADVSFPTKQRMLEIYKVLQEALPNDPAAGHFQQLVSHSNSAQLSMQVREVLGQLTQFAKLEKARAQSKGIQIDGDDLTAAYVREAAAIANDYHSAEATRAMLLALGIFFDDSATLRSFPATSSLPPQVETDEQRQTRISVIGRPSMYGRQDLAKHFFVSAHLTVTMGGSAARGMGLVKELFDSNGGSGFSLADMAANRAGIIFAEKLLTEDITLEQVADSFTVGGFMPEVDGLVEGLQAPAVSAQFADPRSNLAAELKRCEERILALPIYRKSKP